MAYFFFFTRKITKNFRNYVKKSVVKFKFF